MMAVVLASFFGHVSMMAMTQEAMPAMRPMPGTRLVGWSVVVPGFTDCFRFAMENHKFL